MAIFTTKEVMRAQKCWQQIKNDINKTPKRVNPLKAPCSPRAFNLENIDTIKVKFCMVSLKTLKTYCTKKKKKKDQLGGTN